MLYYSGFVGLILHMPNVLTFNATSLNWYFFNIHNLTRIFMNRAPTKSFRLSKSAKRLCASILDPHARGEFRRAMIQAELVAAEAPRRESRDSKGGTPKN